MRRLSAGIALLVASVLVAACGSSPTSHLGQTPKPATQPAHAAVHGRGQAKPLIPFRFSTSFLFNGFQAPYFSALARGYYKAQGLDVKIIEGISPPDSIQWLTSGKVDMTTDVWETVIAVDNKGGKVKVVAGLQQASPFGFIYRKDHPVNTPSDLYNAVIGAPPGSSAAVSLQQFIALSHLNRSKLKIVNAAPATQLGLLGEGKLTVFTAGGYTFLPLAQQAGIPVGYLPFSKFNIGATGDNLVATDQMLKQHPDWVRKFVAATQQGFAFAEAHPRQAAKYEVHYLPKLNPTVTLHQLQLSVPLTPTPYDKGKPWGWMSSRDWERVLSMVEKFQGVKNPLPVSTYYTNAYLPKS